ncbi:MAG: hypothetical protein ACTTK0_10170 [Stomatobaculum sp.]
MVITAPPSNAEDKKKKKKREREEGTEWEEPLDSRSPGYEIYDGV